MEVVKKNPESFLAIDRAETQFAPDMDMYADCVYEKASSMIQEWKANGAFVCDTEKSYYIYLSFGNHLHFGYLFCPQNM